MGQDSVPSTPAGIAQLKKDEKLQDVLARDELDCWSCRLVGAAAFGGLGAYTYWSGHENLRRQESKILRSGTRFGIQSRHTAVTGTALLLVGMGVWRLVN